MSASKWTSNVQLWANKHYTENIAKLMDCEEYLKAPGLASAPSETVLSTAVSPLPQ